MKRGKSGRRRPQRLLAAALGLMLAAACGLTLGLAGGTRLALAETTAPGDTTTPNGTTTAPRFGKRGLTTLER